MKTSSDMTISFPSRPLTLGSPGMSSKPRQQAAAWHPHGIATALLAHALDHARLCGYQRCAVPFEPMNPLGSRFWLKYFQPVCYSFLRNIDNRLAQG